VESCVISGFVDRGIRFDPTTSGARLYVSDTTVRRSDFIGIHVLGGTGVRATLDSVRVHQNFTGVSINSAEATIRESVASGGGSRGFRVTSGSKLVIENSVAANHGIGFYALGGGVMTMTRCATTSNSSHGVFAEGTGSTIYVSDSTIAANGTGVGILNSGVVTSRSNNTLQANTSNGAFTSTFAPN
jgi:hypothetical protein